MTSRSTCLVIASGPSDSTPNFELIGDIQVGDVERMFNGTAANFSGVTEITNTIDNSEMTGDHSVSRLC